jgi:XTP/dITP diphosphohydrolase
VPDETGATFEENAMLKARYYHELTGLVTVADDSGLEVDALDGRPGIASARYGVSDSDRIARLLGELEGVAPAERTARFVCALSLVGRDLAETFTGTCEGRIRTTPAGTNGFGFDPVFTPEGETRSFAEMAPEEKAAVSHRGRALAALAELIRRR